MLHAFLHGKIRTSLDEAEIGGNLVERFRDCEDFLTAAVFERLRYLPGDLFWKVLRKAMIPVGSMPQIVGNLTQSEFWPSWDVSAVVNDRKRCEPDVWLSFDSVDFVVEVKRSDDVRSQEAKQLALEWIGFHEQSKERPMWLLMVGGLGEKDVTEFCVQGYYKEILSVLKDSYGKVGNVQLAGTSWQLIAKSLHEVLGDEQVGANSQIVIEDILAVLQWHDIHWRQFVWLESLGRSAKHYCSILDTSLEGFARRFHGRR
ncbi:MAG: hypothetical protein KF793_06915 [Nitrospira sp.]|nr:hypothetical protein [Nitrospira sp.]